MTYAERVALVEEALETWGEKAARELAERYGVRMEDLAKVVVTSAG